MDLTDKVRAAPGPGRGRFGKVKNDKLAVLAKADERMHVTGTRPESSKLGVSPRYRSVSYLDSRKSASICLFAPLIFMVERCT